MEKNWFPLARKSVSTSQNKRFISKLRFHQTRKKNYRGQECLKNIKKTFPLPESLFPLTRKKIRLKYVSTRRKNKASSGRSVSN